MSNYVGLKQLNSGSNSWATPPGFCGPYMLETVDSTGNRSCLGITTPNTSHTIELDPTFIKVNGTIVMQPRGGTFASTGSIMWWQGIAAYEVVTGSKTWHSPPGNLGPTLVYCPQSGAISFGGVNWSVTSSTGIVWPILVGSNADYSIGLIASSSMTLVWFP